MEPKQGIEPLFLFRSFGFPCDISTKVQKGEKSTYIDRTWMLEDVTSVTSLFTEKNIIPIRETATHICKISESGGDLENYEQVNNCMPGATFFTCYDQTKSSFESGHRPLSKTIHCSSHLRHSSGTIFIYLSGHGLSNEQVEKLNENKASISFGDKHIFNMTREQCTTANQEILSGDIIGFTKFISAKNFIKEFLSTCKNDDQYERHLVLIVDACFSGNWINTIREKKWLKRINFNKKLSILLQTSAESTQKSNGYFFTPLFVHLNRMHENDLQILINDFNSMTVEQKDEPFSINQYTQNPLFYYFQTTADSQYTELESNQLTNQPIYSCHNLRFFTDTNFYQYFAKKFQSIYDIFPDHDRSLRQRPVLLQSETNRLMHSLLIENKVSIRGMKLTRYRHDNTPLCIILLNVKDDYRNHIGPEQYDPWHILHVHFDGTNPFPGTITFGKLLYAISMPMYNNERNEGFTEAADYNQTNKDDQQYPIGCDQYIEGLHAYIQALSQKLANWAHTNWMLPTRDESNRDAWTNPNKWRNVNCIRFGNIAVRERSRFAITKQLICEQEENMDFLAAQLADEIFLTLV